MRFSSTSRMDKAMSLVVYFDHTKLKLRGQQSALEQINCLYMNSRKQGDKLNNFNNIKGIHECFLRSNRRLLSILSFSKEKLTCEASQTCATLGYV